MQMVGGWKVLSCLSSRCEDGGLGGGEPPLEGTGGSLGLVAGAGGLADDVQVEGWSLLAIVVNREHSGLKNHDATDAHCNNGYRKVHLKVIANTGWSHLRRPPLGFRISCSLRPGTFLKCFEKTPGFQTA